MKKEKNVKEKNVDFFSFFRNLISSEPEELTQEEIILSDSTLTADDKKQLLKVLDKEESLGDKLFANTFKSVKHMNLTKNSKASTIKFDKNKSLNNNKDKARSKEIGD